MDVNFSVVARDGLVLAVMASALAMGALRLNPRLFLRHFPAAVKASQPPLSPGEKAARLAVAITLMVLFVGIPVWSARAAAVEKAYGGIETFAHAFLVSMTFNLVDWVVLDEIWLGLGRPRWVLPAGVNPEDVPFDHLQHARGFAIGTAYSAIIGIIALWSA
jgi:hypothetical protein